MGDPPHQSIERADHIPNTPYKFSPEELRVLSRCNRESFYQRSLPLSTLFGLGTYWCVKSGYLKPNPRFGASLKVTGAVIVGYFVGKLSYQQRCAEYFMALPNSEVGEALRKRKNQKYGGGSSDTFGDSGIGAGGSMPSFGLIPSNKDIYSDLSDTHVFTDLDTDRPINDGLNDAYRPSVDYPALEEETVLPPLQGGSVSYDDLRRKNREDFINKSTRPYRNVPTPEDIPSTIGPNPNPLRPSTAPSESLPEKSPTYSKQKNIYGDVWEK
ncbi:OCIA domain-containing protein asrij [Lycorma delicatula]|uniref:OCIA domain-containing protein asrij n=1 Tax=Lycorma delicatula TaxID=130591 RepID=UPI003F5152B7